MIDDPFNRLRGQAALITGGAVRIGRAIALRLAAEGAAVAITYHQSGTEAAGAVEECRALGVPAVALPCNQRNPLEVEQCVAEAGKALGGLNILINNAAIYGRSPIGETSVEEWDRYQETNLRGPWLFSRAALPALQQSGGCIINLLDAAAEHPYPGYLPYCVSKAGLQALTFGLAREAAPAVRVNGIAVGVAGWPEGFSERARESILSSTPLQKTGEPDGVAEAVVYLIGAGYATGAILHLDGGRRLQT